MKFLDTINGSIKKFGKGMLAIFAIKLLLFGGAFVVQSCQTDSIEDSTNIEQQLALSKFESLVRTSTPKIQSVVSKQQNLLLSRSASATDVTAQTEEEAKEVMMPIVQGAKELLSQYGVNEGDLAEEFGTSDDPRTAILGLMTLRIEQLSIENNETTASVQNFLFTPLYAQSALEVVDCALSALGLPAGLVIGSAKNLGTKAILKAAAKLAGRVIGWVGLAVAAYQFVRCLDSYASLDSQTIDVQLQPVKLFNDEAIRFNC